MSSILFVRFIELCILVNSIAGLERDLREAVARYSNLNGDAVAKKEVEHLLRALHARRDPEKIKRGAGPCRMSNESK